ncbi:MAG TPA: prepilin peptidase [Bacillota bacterium]|nr:prepilin peptidase [Bacillota bacterium]
MRFWLYFLLTAISYVDIKKHIIPDIFLLAMLPAAVITTENLLARLAGAAFIWTLFGIAAALSAALKSSVPIGMGDIKLLSVISLVSGPGALFFTVCCGSLLCGPAAALLLALKKLTKKDRIAFGPFIAVSYAFYLASTSAM